MTILRRPLLALTAVALMAALTACGGGDPDATPPVASLPASAGGPTGAGSGDQTTSGDKKADGEENGRPVLRLDDSDDRRFALWNAYSKCLLGHGAVVSSNGMGMAVGRDGRNVIPTLEQPVPKAARAACLSIEPLGPLELEASTNPDFHEQSLAYVDCLREHGEYVRLLNDHNIDWTYVEGHPVPDDQAAFEQECLLDAFGGK